MMKKKFFALFLTIMVLLLSLCGCSSAYTEPEDNTPEILCAAFPEYDWTRNILGDNPSDLRLQLLNDSGMDMHSYQPSVADMVDIADAELVIFTGGDSEFWIEDALISSQSSGDSRRSISLMEVFSHNHELADLYTADEHEENDHDHHHGEEEHAHATDEHLWLSLKLVPSFIREIAQAIAELDPAHADYYEANASEYIARIAALDMLYEETISSAGCSSLLFADRYPFKYLLEDYGLDYVAAFPGCSAETEASFETILKLSDTVNSLELQAVIVLKKSDTALAQTIINNSDNRDAEILILDSMQSVTSKDIDDGATWLSIMESNLQTLAVALD